MKQSAKFYKLISVVVGLCLVLSLCVFTNIKNNQVFASSIAEQSLDLNSNLSNEDLNESVIEMEVDSTLGIEKHLLEEVYFDPAQTSGGSDANSGKTKSNPVTSLTKAKDLVANNGTIYFLSTMNISSSLSLDFSPYSVKLKRYSASGSEQFTGPMLVLGSKGLFVNVIIKNAIIDGSGYGDEPLGVPNSLVQVDNAYLDLLSGSGIVNTVREASGNGIYVEKGSKLYIDGATFKNNKMKDSLIVAKGEVQIDNGTFENNTSLNNSSIILSYGTKIVINNGYFEENKTGALIFCQSGPNTIEINNGTFIRNINALPFNVDLKEHETLTIGSILGFNQGAGSSTNSWQTANVIIGGGDFIGNGSENFGGGLFGVIRGNFYILGGNFKNNFAPVGGVFFCNILQEVVGQTDSLQKKEDTNIVVQNASFFGNVAGYRFRANAPMGTIPYEDIPTNLSLLDTRFLNFKGANNSVYDFTGTLNGGGVFCSTQNVFIDNCRFNCNYSGGDVLASTDNNMQGGGVFLFRGFDATKKLVIGNSFFSDNRTTYYGGVGNGSTGNPSTLGKSTDISIYSSNFINNHAKNGGVLYGQGNIYMVNSYFIENYAQEKGGAVYIDGAVDNCTFEKNHTDQNGGAIYSDNITISGSKFQYNFAVNGSAIYTNILKLSSSLIRNNLITGPIQSSGNIFIKEGTVCLDNIIIDNVAGVILNNEDKPTPNQITQEKVIFEQGYPKVGEDGRLVGGNISDLFVYLELKDKLIFEGKSSQNNGKIKLYIQGISGRVNKEPIFQMRKITNLQEVLDSFSLHDTQYSLWGEQDLSSGAFKVYVSSNKSNPTYYFIASDYVGPYDGKLHTINLEVYGPEGKTDYSKAEMKFGTTETCDSAILPEYASTGPTGITIYFRIGTEGTVHSRKIIITNTNLAKTTGFKLTVKYGEILRKGDDVTALFKEKLLDQRGNQLSGGKFTISSTLDKEIKCIPGTNEKIAIIYEPNNKMMEPTTIYLDENDSFIYENYDNLYFDSTNTFHLSSTYEPDDIYKIPKHALQFIFDHMNNNGTITFASSFICDNDFNVQLRTGNRVILKRTNQNIRKMFGINAGQSLKIEVLKGNLILNGDLSGVENGALIKNDGNLVLKGNIQIIKAKNNYTLELESNAGALHNTGTALLDGGVNSLFVISKCVSKLYGGAIYNEGILTIKNIKITDGLALQGGAIYNTGGASKLNIENCDFNMNGAYINSFNAGEKYASGFTIFADSGIVNISNSNIMSSKLYNGSKPVRDAFEEYNQIDFKGSGIFINSQAFVNMNNVIFNDCVAYSGGAIYLKGTLNCANVVISRCKVVDAGASLYSEEGATVQNLDILSNGNSFLIKQKSPSDPPIEDPIPVVKPNLDILVKSTNNPNNLVDSTLWVSIILAVLCSLIATPIGLVENKITKKHSRNKNN